MDTVTKPFNVFFCSSEAIIIIYSNKSVFASLLISFPFLFGQAIKCSAKEIIAHFYWYFNFAIIDVIIIPFNL